jgi:hypothetical protein
MPYSSGNGIAMIPDEGLDDLTHGSSYSSEDLDTTTVPDVVLKDEGQSTVSASFGVWTELRSPSGRLWSQNYPPFREEFYIASYKRNIADKSSKLLIAGGVSGRSRLRDTWIYTPWTNSWLELPNGNQLPPMHAWGHPVLPVLCETFVVLILSVEDVWVFDGRTESWTLLFVKPDAEEYFSSSLGGAVALQTSPCDANSRSCNCSGSIFLYGLSNKRLFSLQMYELKCVSNRDEFLDCQWVLEPQYLQFISQDDPTCAVDLINNVKAHGLMAVADQSRRVIYFARRCLDLDFGITERVILFSYTDRSRSDNITKLGERKLDRLAFNMSKGICFKNAFLWKNAQAMFADTFNTFSLSLNNQSLFQLLTPKKRIKSEKCPCNDVILTMSSGPVRLKWSWESEQVKNPNIYIYHTFSVSKGFPIFQQKKQPFPPIRDPGVLLHYTPVYDYDSQTFYLYGGIHKNGRPPTGYLWALSVSVPSKTWYLTKPHQRPGVYLSNCGTYSMSQLILFGGQYGNKTVGDELWLYNTQLRTWSTPYRSGIGTDTWPRARAKCSLAASPDGSIIALFGGYSSNRRPMSDVWILYLENNGTTVRWRHGKPATVEKKTSITTPLPRFGHSSVMAGKELIIYGGRSNFSDRMEDSCLFDMWGFHLSSRIWRRIISLPRQHGLNLETFVGGERTTGFCDTFLTNYGESRILAMQSLVRGEPEVEASGSIWMIDISSLSRLKVKSPGVSIRVQAVGILDGSLVIYGSYSTNFNDGRHETGLLAVGGPCEPGFSKINGPAEPCMPCKIGQYSTVYLNVRQCVDCPRGTTTLKANTTSAEGCICDIKYCVHGACQRVSQGNVFGAVCNCSFGFMGRRCNKIEAAVFLLSFGLLIAVTIVATTLAWCGIRTARHHRARKKTEWELNEMQRTFTVLPWEVTLLCRLDRNCPGGYGQVHKATYRDWTVAIKQLHLDMAEWADIRNDFLREIRFMRTVRHPNVVMFIGAGQYKEKQPFLVLEFMSGGALRSLLQNVDEVLTRGNRLQFILDIAEGMKYLHTLQPPRIHRDLKSANLLLSGTRRVKVADFGCARLIPQMGNLRSRENTNRNTGIPGEESDTLLDESLHLTTRFIGTARWRSPELWQRKSYGMATDVYR